MRDLVYVGIAMHPEAEEILRQRADVTHDPAKRNTADAVIVYSPEASWPEEPGYENLRAIGCHVCEEPVLSWAKKKGVSITEAGSLWRTVAEHTLALMLGAARQISGADQAVRNGEWTDHEQLKVRFSGHDLQGKTLGIWGLGQIGKELAEMVRGFRMRVLYNDLVRDQKLERDLGLEFVGLGELLKESDYFILLLPLNDQTSGIMGKEEFSQLKKGCIFVNTARAGIVDESAFLDAMTDGTIGFAALDVQWDEPLTEGPELAFDNIVFTPHLGGSTCQLPTT